MLQRWDEACGLETFELTAAFLRHGVPRCTLISPRLKVSPAFSKVAKSPDKKIKMHKSVFNGLAQGVMGARRAIPQKERRAHRKKRRSMQCFTTPQNSALTRTVLSVPSASATSASKSSLRSSASTLDSSGRVLG